MSIVAHWPEKSDLLDRQLFQLAIKNREFRATYLLRKATHVRSLYRWATFAMFGCLLTALIAAFWFRPELFCVIGVGFISAMRCWFDAKYAEIGISFLQGLDAREAQGK
jgi:hypothetical protein